jgi:hypothetical protein
MQGFEHLGRELVVGVRLEINEKKCVESYRTNIVQICGELVGLGLAEGEIGRCTKFDGIDCPMNGTCRDGLASELRGKGHFGRSLL